MTKFLERYSPLTVVSLFSHVYSHDVPDHLESGTCCKRGMLCCLAWCLRLRNIRLHRRVDQVDNDVGEGQRNAAARRRRD